MRRANIIPLVIGLQAVYVMAQTRATGPTTTTPLIYSSAMTFAFSDGQYRQILDSDTTSLPTMTLTPSAMEVPQPASVVALSSVANAASTDLAANDDAQPTSLSMLPAVWTSYDTVIVVHAVLGSIAWLLAAPVIIFLTSRLLFRSKTGTNRQSWSSVQCSALQGSITGMVCVASAVAGAVATNIRNSRHFSNAHHAMGWVLLGLLLLQVITVVLVGSIRSMCSHESLLRMQIVTSTVLTGLGFAELYLGFGLYEVRSGRAVPTAVKAVWAILVGCISLALVVVVARSCMIGSAFPGQHTGYQEHQTSGESSPTLCGNDNEGDKKAEIMGGRLASANFSARHTASRAENGGDENPVDGRADSTTTLAYAESRSQNNMQLTRPVSGSRFIEGPFDDPPEAEVGQRSQAGQTERLSVLACGNPDAERTAVLPSRASRAPSIRRKAVPAYQEV